MLISCVIPLYNNAQFIERAIRSVLNQTYQNFQLIIVNDGSTDGGGELVENIPDSRIRLIHQKNQGASAARNRGIKEARGHLIAFLDADDEWKPKFLETILKLEKKFPQAGAYATAYEMIFPNGKVVIPKFKYIPSSPWEGLIPNYFRSGLGPSPVSASAVAVPASVFKKVGNFVVGKRRGEDLDMWGRIAMTYPIAFSWQIGAIWYYYWHTINRATTFLRNPHFIKTASRAIDRGQVPVEILADLKEYIANYQINYAFACLLWTREPKLARKRLMESKPRTVRRILLKYWWCLWTFFPLSIVDFASWIKRKLLGKK